MTTMTSETFGKLSFAVAREEPVGVIIAGWSGRLSRMYRWDLESDAITPGQFVKARASVLAISPNGKYVVYYAEALRKRGQAYVALSHLPYFTAKALWAQYSNGIRTARFLSNSLLEVGINRGFDEELSISNDRVDPGCPMEIKRINYPSPIERPDKFQGDTSLVGDTARNREIRAEQMELVEYKLPEMTRRVLATFPKEPFEEVVPPDWARRW